MGLTYERGIYPGGTAVYNHSLENSANSSAPNALSQKLKRRHVVNINNTPPR